MLIKNKHILETKVEVKLSWKYSYSIFVAHIPFLKGHIYGRTNLDKFILLVYELGQHELSPKVRPKHLVCPLVVVSSKAKN